MDNIEEAFDAALRSADRAFEESQERTLLPLTSIPYALELLGLDPDDSFVLDLFKDTAAPMTPGKIRRGAEDQGVPFGQFRQVCEVLLSSTTKKEYHRPGSSLIQRGRRHGVSVDVPSEASESELSDCQGSGADDEYLDDEECQSEIGEDGDYHAAAPPLSSRVTAKQAGEAAEVLRILQSKTGSRPGVPSTSGLSAQDLRDIAANVGEKLSENDAQEMIEEAVKIRKIQASGRISIQEGSLVGTEELIAVLRRLNGA
ncbi:hypothetical protein K437DRAFT_270252 [Tilletiaria anomala UBC 951]|uniref:Uncharacterized protein n=1 Tax=Tilletiaria anomala (strain ATCC 24038 / CBS 436.72 / UBC 951) TaxID=1037660 RepID=A0A066VLR2_TILAU|nr:uncharacterized protein K437DRAFT_270252 [Tilletiaria anomala UBC 951]KDN39520.1 hypothetical protein K437DRAFT_270252 [Tilletiaria anomala UBC 951]